MPVKRFPKKKVTKKKVPKVVPKQPSKMTYKQLMRKTPEMYTDLVRLNRLFTPFRFSFQDGITGDNTNAYAADAISAVNCADPSAANGTRQPYLFDQLMAIYSYGHVKRFRITLDFMDNSTTTATAYYVYLIVDSNLFNFSTNPVQTADDLLESRERRIRPAYSLVQSGPLSTAGGRRRLKLEFDIHKAVGVKRSVWDAGENDIVNAYRFNAASGSNYCPVWYGLVSADGTALPNTVGGRFTIKTRYLAKLYDPIDLGTS